MTLNDLKVFYYILNYDLFDGEIPPTQIKWLDSKDETGLFTAGIDEYPCIHIRKELTDILKIETLLHEMCHAYVTKNVILGVYKKSGNDHGRDFKRIYKKIFGRPYREDELGLPLWMVTFSSITSTTLKIKKDTIIKNYNKSLELCKADWTKNVGGKNERR